MLWYSNTGNEFVDTMHVIIEHFAFQSFCAEHFIP